ncbi:MAG: hypothetical protein JXR94_23165 [Candidatus Hydrogenedentes bacterium]|nr:hypothetical protein [Candidatus Hydrogenedentota bacterium]
MSKRGRVHLVIACVAGVALLAGCSGKTDLRLHLKPGDKRVVEVTNNLTTTAPGKGGQESQTDTSVHKYTYDVQSVDESGTATVQVKMNLDTIFGAGMGALGEMAGALATLGSELGEIAPTIELLPDGSIVSVSGMAEIATKVAEVMREEMKKQIAELMKQFGPEAAAMMGAGGEMDRVIDKSVSAIKKELGNEAMKDDLGVLTGYFPPEPVGKGSTWTKTSKTSNPIAMTLTNTYTVTQRGGGVMNIACQGQIASDPGAGVDLGMIKMSFDVSGTVTGTMQVDEATGWVTASSMDILADGNMKMGPMDMPIKVEGNIYTRTYAP